MRFFLRLYEVPERSGPYLWIVLGTQVG